MTTNVTNQMPFLRTTRQFPQELQQLTTELTKSYIDIANTMNERVIGMFPVNRPAITGENYFLVNNQKQQTLRQVYNFTSTSSINHGINVTDPNQFTLCFGSYTNGTNSFGLIFGSSVAIAGQISFYLTSTQIVFETGAGAPSLSKGRIVLTWLSQP